MKRYVALLLIITNLSACSIIYSYDDNIENRVRQWVEEENYITALDTINHISPTHPNYTALQKTRKKILQQLKKLEQQTIKASNVLAAKGEWLLALKRIDEAEAKLVNTDKLNAHKQKLLVQRNKILQVYEYNLLYARAKYLSSKVTFYEQIRKMVDIKEDDKFNRVEFDRLCQETSERLLVQAEQEYKENKYHNALATVNLALSLKPNKTTRLRLTTVKNLIQKLNKTKQLANIISAKKLLNSLSNKYSYDSLKEIQNKIDWFNKNKALKKEHRELNQKLEVHLKLGTKHYFNTARKLYSIGKIEEALSIWLELKEIVPEYPKLNAHIKRSKKILKKLKRLSDKTTEK